jgi:hypothetical protein
MIIREPYGRRRERAAPSQWTASPYPPTRAPEYESQGAKGSPKPAGRGDGGKAAESLKGETLRYPLLGKLGTPHPKIR